MKMDQFCNCVWGQCDGTVFVDKLISDISLSLDKGNIIAISSHISGSVV